ncbi:MAG: TolC family protein [Candidatus Thioglobus sp.]|uniref:TolC family protein n=1 Tax=Candidatus Thioglobus sp. TaxID=2026721 RepID=UPI00260EAC68|nr:TolC family protein [Candidatus Thioglobus sp.]MDC9726831.1 TolC family protein [Candidatus Thioglobus sp.]
MKTLSTASFALLFSVNAVAMTQAEFVERLQIVHPFFTQQNFDQQTSKLDYVATTANQDWVLTGSVDSANTSNNQVSSASISATHNLIDSGADVSINNVWSDGTASDKLSLSYTQPLLKGANGVNDLLATDLSTIQIEINRLKRTQLAEQFILKQLFKLVDLSFAQRQLALTTQRLTLAQQELSLVKDKFEQSVVDRVDVLLQEDAYQRALQKQLQAEQALELLVVELSTLLNVKSRAVTSGFDLYELYSSKLIKLDDYLQRNTTEMQISALEQDKLRRQLLSDQSNTQAQLDLKLGLSDSTSNDWNVGLDLSYPIGGTKAKTALEQTQIKLSKAGESAKEELIDLTVKANVLNKKQQHLAKLLDTYQVRINIAKARALAEKRRYELGNSSMSFVIAAQNNVHDINLSYAQEATRYQKSVLEFKAVIGQLL